MSNYDILLLLLILALFVVSARLVFKFLNDHRYESQGLRVVIIGPEGWPRS